MGSQPDITKYVPAEARVVSIGIAPDHAQEIAGREPVACHGTPAAFLSSEGGEIHALLLSSDSLTPGLLAALPARLAAKGVVVVECPVVPGATFLDSPAVPPVVRALSEGAYSILTPPRWLDRAEEPSLLVVARLDVYEIRGYEPGDETKILDLFEASFHHRRSVDHWRWEFEVNPHGSYAISMAFDGEGELVAQYAGYPVPLWSADPAIDGLCAHQIGDTMTAVRIRSVGRGHTSLVVRTAKHFFASRCAKKIAFNYGFNTANIQKMSFAFIECLPVEPVPYRRVEIAALEPMSRGSRFRKTLLRAYSVSRTTTVDEDFDRFFQRAAPAYGLLVRRDARYLKWRYLDSPVWKYELIALRSAGRLVGWSVFRRRDDTLIWGDALFLAGHAEAAGLVLRHALDGPIGQGARFLEGWFPSRPAFWGSALDELGFTSTQEPNDLGLICTPFLVEDTAQRLQRDLYYTACDSDLY